MDQGHLHIDYYDDFIKYTLEEKFYEIRNNGCLHRLRHIALVNNETILVTDQIAKTRNESGVAIKMGRSGNQFFRVQVLPDGSYRLTPCTEQEWHDFKIYRTQTFIDNDHLLNLCEDPAAVARIYEQFGYNITTRAAYGFSNDYAENDGIAPAA